MLLVESHQLDQQRNKRAPQLLAAALRPLLVAVFGQELPRIQLDGRTVGGCLSGAAGGGRRFLEGLHIDPKLPLRA